MSGMSIDEISEEMFRNGQILEQLMLERPEYLVLYCEECESPYSIKWVDGGKPYCESCFDWEKTEHIIAVEWALPQYDNNLQLLCNLMLWSIENLDEDNFQTYLSKTYRYIFGDNYYELEMWMDQNINWLYIDYTFHYTDDQQAGLLDDIIYRVKELIEDRDSLIHTVERYRLKDYGIRTVSNH